jgi:hypothetical protein
LGGILHSLHARVFFEAISLPEFKNGIKTIFTAIFGRKRRIGLTILDRKLTMWLKKQKKKRKLGAITEKVNYSYRIIEML